MMNFTFSPKYYFYTITGLFLTIAGLYYGRGFLIPFSFSLLIAFILVPSVRWLENRKIPSVISIILVFIGVVLGVLGIVYFFGSQIARIVSDFNTFTENLGQLLSSGIQKYNSTFTMLPPIDEELVLRKVVNFFESSGGSILTNTFAQTSAFLASTFLVPVYVFLLLLYRKGIKKGIMYFFKPAKRPKVEEVLYDVQGVGRNYIVGLVSVMLILAIVNSTMLLIIGVDYAIMFGSLAAILIIIPYIGTYIGSALPILYALVTMDLTHAIIILIGFILVQAIEGNFLTPKIVGTNTNVNALTAFIALIVGGYIWGIAGMVLSIPFIAMLKKVFRHVSGLQPLALLMGEELYEDDIEVPDIEDLFDNQLNLQRVKPEKLVISRFQKVKNIFNIWFGKNPIKSDDNEDNED